MNNFAPHVAEILDKGYKFTAYYGEYDFICNPYGGDAWTKALQWNGTADFNAGAEVMWNVNGVNHGMRRTGFGANGGELTFLRITDAGHLAPMDKPLETLA